VSPEVKNLIWLMCRGCLPTRVRLQDKGVQCPKNCVSCDSSNENLAHICFKCPFTGEVLMWISLWDTIHMVFIINNSATDAISKLLHLFSQELSQWFVVIL
jgi:hypothetical protein